MGWLDINVESLSVFVTTESDFQTPEEVLLLSMEFQQLAGIHFEDQTPLEETQTQQTQTRAGQGGRTHGVIGARIKGPPVMQVREQRVEMSERETETETEEKTDARGC